jgi:hypothetical protein
MSLFIIFNTVYYDGIGDFFHFEGIMEAMLQNNKFIDVKFVAFIHFDARGSESNFKFIENKLNTGLCQKSERVQVHFGDMSLHENLVKSPKLQNILENAKQGVIISNDFNCQGGGSLVELYFDFCPFLYQNLK